MTLGEKIQKLRKQRGLSQEALAEKVTVTRQTISKWELGQSTPDLDFIAQLSDIFNVSSDYLIKDEMTEPDELPYKKRNYRLSERGKRIILVIVSAAALIAGCVCLICDYFTSDRLSWSLIVAVSIIAAWLMLLPSLISRTKIVLKTLVVISAIPIPLLAILSLLCKVSYIHAGHLHNANCDCCNLGNIWNFPQVQEKYVESIWFCPVGFDPSADCDYPYFRLFFATSPVRFYI